MKRIHPKQRAFTLLELLVVIGIIGVLATLGVGALRGFSAVNVVAAGNRQLLDDLNMARNHAINQRTTVYVVFVPLLKDLNFSTLNAEQNKRLERRNGTQLIGYNFLTLRSLGDQPGKGRSQYLTEWKTLPDGVFIAADEFFPLDEKTWMDKASKGETNLPMPRISVPFPTANSPKVLMPCIAFNYRGELIGPRKDPRRVDEFITLTRGSYIPARDSNGKYTREAPETIETPRGNSTNNPHLRIDWVTGRARIEEPGT